LGTFHTNKFYPLSRSTRKQSERHPLGHLATQT
jgi:hypothetical protein